MNEQYVNFPEKIVPKISIERIENFLKNEKFLKDLLDKQIEFINLETGNDNQRIANFNQLNL